MDIFYIHHLPPQLHWPLAPARRRATALFVTSDYANSPGRFCIYTRTHVLPAVRGYLGGVMATVETSATDSFTPMVHAATTYSSICRP
jgi:hypothetical protein